MKAYGGLDVCECFFVAVTLAYDDALHANGICNVAILMFLDDYLYRTFHTKSKAISWRSGATKKAVRIAANGLCLCEPPTGLEPVTC